MSVHDFSAQCSAADAGYDSLMAPPSAREEGGRLAESRGLICRSGLTAPAPTGLKCSHLLSVATIKSFMNTFWDNSKSVL